MSDETEGVRLQKVLAAAGVASRRASEIMIDEGRVEVNGKIVTEQGRRVNPDRDQIRVDGSRIPPPRRHMYLVLNKPRGVISTMDDPEGRTTLADYLPRTKERLFHVGRLDTETEGLIILTNDGEFAHRLAHPSYEVRKSYHVQVAGVMDNRTLKRLEKGVTLDDGPVKPDKVKLISRGQDRTLLQVSLHEGRNRIVRRIFESLGYSVRKLDRVYYAGLTKKNLKRGAWRFLTKEEVMRLKSGQYE